MSSEREVYICEHCSTKLFYADLIFGKIPRIKRVFVARDECMNDIRYDLAASLKTREMMSPSAKRARNDFIS